MDLIDLTYASGTFTGQGAKLSHENNKLKSYT